MVQEIIRAAITLLAVINPAICGVMLLEIDGEASRKQHFIDATRCMLAVLMVLVLSALLGKYILQVFGISIDVFKVVGGVVIAYIGFGMFGSSKMKNDGEPKQQKSLSTLIMFAASPGTIATIISLSAVHSVHGIPIVAMVGAGFAALLTWLVMVMMMVVPVRMQPGGQQIVTKLLGLILISMGLQFVLTGLKDFMTG